MPRSGPGQRADASKLDTAIKVAGSKLQVRRERGDRNLDLRLLGRSELVQFVRLFGCDAVAGIGVNHRALLQQQADTLR